MLIILYSIVIFSKTFLHLLQEIFKVYKKIFFILVILIALAFGGLSVYVSTIDWNLHKNKIAEQFEEISGKKIVFEGPVSLSFFPSPYLSAKDIKIYNQTGNDTNQPLAVIEEMVTDLALLPLIQGNFVIDNMSLLNADILVEFLPNGKLNWYSEITDFQRDKLDTVDVSLNSVLLKEASVHIINNGLGIDVNLQNLNAEVTAESLFGPYRIDGNFVKDNNPAGFALNLGTLSENFSTSLNLVLTHPTTESYARFDGSMLSSNKEIKGNFIIESKKPSNFINELTNQVILPAEFNYPLACSIELITNEQQIDLSSFIIKYGDNTAGSGNILIPLKPNPNEEKRKIETSFEMTDMDLMPIIGIIKEQLKKYDKNQTPYEPYYDFDLIADIKAVKANFNGQPIRNFNLSADLVNDVFTIKNMSGLYAGDTDIYVSGDIFEKEQTLTYNFNIKGISQDFLKFLELINIKPQIYAQSTYKNASANFVLSGNLNKIGISPLNMTIDKTNMSGNIAFTRDTRKKISLNLNIDDINFDNYVPSLTEEEKLLPLNEKIKLILNKLSFLNNYDINSDIKLERGIYSGSSYEKSILNFLSENGVIKIENFNVENFNNALFKISGEISNLNAIPHFKDIKYTLQTSNLETLLKKINLNIPLVKDIQKAHIKGIFTGDTNNINIKAVTSLDKLSSVYSGRLYKTDNHLNYNGNLEFRSPDFVDFVNRIGFNYRPQYMAANIFTFKGDIEGNSQNWRAKNIDAFIGSSNFKGDLSVINEGYPQITANIHANNFEFDRFIYNPETLSVRQVKKTKTIDTSLNFFKQPTFDATTIDYDIYKKFDLNGKLSIDTFSIQNQYFNNATADLEIKQGLINIKNINAQVGEAPVSADIVFDINSNAKVKGNIKITDYDISRIGGKRYEFLSGKLSSTFQFDAPATSFANFIKGLNGSAVLDFTNLNFKGWNLLAIEEDIRHRTHSDNLYEMLRTNLQNGESLIYRAASDFDIKEGVITITNTLLETDQANVKVDGSVNLSEWSINSDFSLTFNQLKDKIVPIEYQWTGALNNPNLVINSSALKNKYDSYWEKVRIEKEAAEKARLKDLNERMSTAQNKVVTLTEFMENKILPRFKKYSQLSSNVTTRSKYKNINLTSQDIKLQLESLQQLAQKDFSDEDITLTNAKTEVFEAQLDTLLRELDETYITDLRNLSNDIYGSIHDIYTNSLKKGVNYQNALDTYVQRLIKVKSLVILDNEPESADYKNKIETSLRNIADLHNKTLNIKNDINNSDKIIELELNHQILKETLEKINAETDVLNSSMNDLFEYAKNIVRIEEEEAIKKQEALKAAQESALASSEEKTSDTSTVATKPAPKQKSKIIIIEEGQKINTPELKTEIKTHEGNKEDISEKQTLSVKVKDLKTEEKNTETNTRNPFTINTKQQNEESETLKSSEQSSADIQQQLSEKSPTDNLEQKPILKMIDNTASYRSKMATSGVITKPASSKNNNKPQNDTPKTESFLRLSTGAEIVSEGTITKSK